MIYGVTLTGHTTDLKQPLVSQFVSGCMIEVKSIQLYFVEPAHINQINLQYKVLNEKVVLEAKR